MRKILIFTISFILVLIFNTSYAEELVMKERAGAGIQLNALNFGLGPTVEYWPTENIGVSGSVGIIGSFKSYGVRGNYLFDKKSEVWGLPARPYVGIGYASIEGPEYSLYGTTAKTKGSGIELYGGILQPAPSIAENVYIRPELLLSTVTLETTIETTYFGKKYSEKYSGNYGAFSIGLGIVYYFK